MKVAIRYVDRKTGEIKIESPPGEGLLRFLYDNPFGKKGALPLAKRKVFTAYYGKKMNKPSSAKKISKFVKNLDIDLSESEKSLSEFTCFNDFFYRKLKSDARPIEDGLVSPGDGRLLAFENISKVNQFFVKGSKFTLDSFLMDSELAKKFENYSMIILRLAPNDYHRYHFPFSGIPSKSKSIQGKYYSVSPIALAANFTKVFTQNKREYCILETERNNPILISPVGATMVGSIISTYSPNRKVEKGDEMGYFAFGGSTVVLLVDSQHFKIDSDILENTNNRLESYVRMGEKIGETR